MLFRKNTNGTSSSPVLVNSSSGSIYPHHDQFSTKETSLSTTPSRYSLDSTEETSFSRDRFSLHKNINYTYSYSSSSITTQDSAYSTHATSTNVRGASSEDRNSRKKLAEVSMTNELQDDEVEALLSASKAECNDLKRQIEQLKIQLEDSAAKEEGIDRIRKELEEQEKFLKESNANLFLQLTKTQQSNIDLLSVLQEMEETIENQRMGDDRDVLKQKVESLERDCSALTDENLQLVLKLKEMENLQASSLHGDLMGKDVLISSEERELERRYRETSASIDLDDDCEVTKGTYFITQSGQHETVLKKLADMRNLVDYRDDGIEAAETVIMDDNSLQSIDQQLGNLHGMLESRLKDLQKEVERAKSAREEELKVEVSKLEAEISSMELECNRSELEGHLCEVEEENLRLSERICGLEAQLRYLTNEKETSRLTLHNSESRSLKLDQHVRELEVEVEGRKKMANEIQKQLLEAKDECGYLKVAHQNMEATAEAMIEECSSLQKSNLDLRRQKMELQEQCNLLEAELSESRRSFDSLSEEIQALREKLPSLSEETHLKESAIKAELDALILETTTLSNNTRLLQEFDIAEIPLFPESINLKFDESEARLKDELAESRQTQEVLMSDREKLLDLVEDFKSKESRTKARMRILEMKLKACEVNRKELVDDVRRSKVQLSRTQVLERNLKEATFENQRLEASLQVIRGTYESVLKENDVMAVRVSRLESEVLKLESCRNSKEVLEERVLRLEGDLTAMEALYSEEAELKNELARVRRANNQLQRRLHEQDQRARALQEEQQRKNSYSSSTSSCIVEEDNEEQNHNSLPMDKTTQNKSQFKSDVSLEKELTEVREKYLKMSLMYAVVDADMG